VSAESDANFVLAVNAPFCRFDCNYRRSAIWQTMTGEAREKRGE